MTDAPINQFLWDITLPAVRAAWAAGRDYAASGKRYVPRLVRPEYRENEFGWPSTLERDRFERSDNASIDWAEMFGPAGGQFTHVAVEDVPELSAAIDELVEATRRDSDLGSRMNPFNHSDDVEWREDHLKFDYRKKVVAAVIARAEATGVESDEDLLDIYLQLERARFLTTLSGDLVVPVILTDFGSEEAIKLGEGVHIERLSDDLQCARAPHPLFSEQVNPNLTAAATHAIVVEEISIDNSSYAQRILGGIWGMSPIRADDMSKVDRAIEVIHIITSAPTGYTQVVIRPNDWADGWIADLPPLWKVSTRNNYPASEGIDPPWRRPRAPLSPNSVSELGPAFAALIRARKDVGLAARRAVRAMMRTDDEDRTLDATIGIEALLLDKNPELRFRMALRAAAALHEEYDPATIFALAKNVYDHRSEIAHGSSPTKTTFQYAGQMWKTADTAPSLLRALLRSYLLAKKPWTKEELDGRVLAALAAYAPKSDTTSAT